MYISTSSALIYLLCGETKAKVKSYLLEKRMDSCVEFTVSFLLSTVC